MASAGTPVAAGTAWQTAGRTLPKRTGLAIVTGTKLFPTDLTRPGLLHAKVLRPPAFGATLRSAGLTAAEAMAGVVVVREGDFVGAAAPDERTAQRALQAISATWDLVPQPSEGELEAYLRSHPIAETGWEGAFHSEQGNAECLLRIAPVTLAATYTTAYLAHAPLDPRVALAEQNGRLTVWTGTQQPFGVTSEVAAALGLPEVDLRVVAPDAGGGFGGKQTGTTAAAAARLARAAHKPVKLLWTAEEELTWSHFRPAAVIDVRSGALADGTLTALQFKNWNAGPAAIQCPYDIAHQRIDYQPSASPLQQGPYRALAATANHFARECHLDEMAYLLGSDPLELRLRHLHDERLMAVFNAAAERFGWGLQKPLRSRCSTVCH